MRARLVALRNRLASVLEVAGDDDDAGSAEPEPTPAAATPDHAAALRRAPVPDGWSEADLMRVFHSFRIDDSPPGAMAPYADDAMWRFLHTLSLADGIEGRALELGANPYFITWLLERFTELDLDCANYFDGPPGPREQTLAYELDGTVHEQTVPFEHFNLEEDRFPYDDDVFDLVVFCEIIEHLLNDPLHTLREIHRVLQPGGHVVISTPNVARAGNVVGIVAGENIYDPYSGFGPYGRHNREFNLHELVLLVKFAGFTVEQSFTADAHAEDLSHRPAYDDLMRLTASRAPDLGQYLFVLARADSEPRPARPSFLYRSWPPDEIVEYP